MTNTASIRLCLGCKHCEFTARSESYGCSTCGPMTDESTQFKCEKGHFHRFIRRWSNGEQMLDLENALLNAATCQDFTERTP